MGKTLDGGVLTDIRFALARLSKIEAHLVSGSQIGPLQIQQLDWAFEEVQSARKWARVSRKQDLHLVSETRRIGVA